MRVGGGGGYGALIVCIEGTFLADCILLIDNAGG